MLFFNITLFRYTASDGILLLRGIRAYEPYHN